MLIIFCALLYITFDNYCMENNNNTYTPLTVYAIPGSGGKGSSPEYVKKLLESENLTVVPVETPRYFSDFGQKWCMHYLKNAVDEVKKKKQNSLNKALIHATSLGTATALNYVAHEDKNNHIKCLILEAALASGNSALEYKAQDERWQWLAHLPLSYYWLPYCVKIRFPFYSPSGKQPIKSLAAINKELPIIIAHAKNDTNLSYDDAGALCYGLCAHGNKNVYFITKEGEKHTNILENDAALVRAILTKHDLLAGGASKTEMDLSPYQPDYQNFKKRYHELREKEDNHEFFRNTLLVGTCVSVYMIKKLIDYCKT